MTRQVVLLRGINVGTHGRIAMAALRELLRQAGYSDVRTYLQSGNVVLASEDPPLRLGRQIKERVHERLGIDTDVIVRTRDEIADVIARNPFDNIVDDPKLYQVTFLSTELAPQVVYDLETADTAPERLVVSGREIYAWHQNGIQRSPLARLLTDRRLGVTATARNWNTVTKLLALADE
jgi:uncharacterized protein (DUF1697 family)